MTKRQTPPDNLDTDTGQLAEADWLARYVQTDGGGDLVNGIRDLIRSGRLQTGARLPTVRMLAPLLGVSPATVAGAWSRLRDLGLIETRRRGGTVVTDLGPRVAAHPAAADAQSWDLAQGLIDYALLPDLRQALLAGLDESSVHRASKEHAVPSLIAAVAPTWPFQPDAWSTAGSGTEGTLLAIQAAAGERGVVAIESPTSPRLLDICATLGVELVAVDCDERGPTPASLRAALAREPAAFVYQPRAQVPLGHAIDAARLSELARELEPHPGTQIVEDDFIGPLSQVAAPSMGALLPERTLLVRGYCNTYGIDLRTCVIGGSSRLVDKVRRLRSFGAAMNSRILQGALAWLLRDERTSAAVARARQRYASRRSVLLKLLQDRGLTAQGADGLNLWVSVPNEETAIVSLAAHGISVGSGRRCHVGPKAGEFLRVSTARLPDNPAELEHIADCFAEVLTAQRPDGMILGHE
ncbi:GntR family transcriptional regulator [Paraburkholderia caballeronis]|uniref:aminotransferase class I/II-fold pyridoxal phosphate-dependent enzyme n=1 Tax=Paraburkholderia caballeronis TaxID=416943 RepID=UPI0010663EEC|nr:aminotransferase class I/II-fold pyridoxal phosphate-dependent enzyme [Paraburkholderia caballeronis]TDV39400.1 GntR family transcriptional regulator [Paraburkholderia caballeronis]